MDRFWRFNSYLKTVFRERLLRGKSSVRTVTLSAAEREQRNGEIAFTMVRVGAGGIVIPHGLSQLLGGTRSIAAVALARNGFEPSLETTFFIILLELVGGICVTTGLFTRAFAGALAMEMWWVASAIWSDRSSANLGWEYARWEFPLFLGCLMFALTLRGGGRWSLDRMLGNA